MSYAKTPILINDISINGNTGIYNGTDLSDLLQQNTINSLGLDVNSRTIWINGQPYGNAYVNINIPTNPPEDYLDFQVEAPIGAEIFNNYALNQAHAQYSSAVGNGTKTSNTAEFACGRYNDSQNGILFSVGNGSDDDNRSNAFVINDQGECITTDVKLTTMDSSVSDSLIDNSVTINNFYKFTIYVNRDDYSKYYGVSCIKRYDNVGNNEHIVFGDDEPNALITYYDLNVIPIILGKINVIRINPLFLQDFIFVIGEEIKDENNIKTVAPISIFNNSSVDYVIDQPDLQNILHRTLNNTDIYFIANPYIATRLTPNYNGIMGSNILGVLLHDDNENKYYGYVEISNVYQLPVISNQDGSSSCFANCNMNFQTSNVKYYKPEADGTLLLEKKSVLNYKEFNYNIIPHILPEIRASYVAHAYISQPVNVYDTGILKFLGSDGSEDINYRHVTAINWVNYEWVGDNISGYTLKLNSIDFKPALQLNFHEAGVSDDILTNFYTSAKLKGIKLYSPSTNVYATFNFNENTTNGLNFYVFFTNFTKSSTNTVSIGTLFIRKKGIDGYIELNKNTNYEFINDYPEAELFNIDTNTKLPNGVHDINTQYFSKIEFILENFDTDHLGSVRNGFITNIQYEPDYEPDNSNGYISIENIQYTELELDDICLTGSLKDAQLGTETVKITFG